MAQKLSDLTQMSKHVMLSRTNGIPGQYSLKRKNGVSVQSDEMIHLQTPPHLLGGRCLRCGVVGVVQARGSSRTRSWDDCRQCVHALKHEALELAGSSESRDLPLPICNEEGEGAAANTARIQLVERMTRYLRPSGVYWTDRI